MDTQQNFLSKNIAPMIDLLIVALTITIDLLALTHQLNTDNSLVTLVIGSVNTYMATVLTFHRGSSANSQKKDDTIRELKDKP